MPTRYRYKGSAYAAAGILHTPCHEIIPTQASANLADFGGHGQAHVEMFRHRDILHFDHAHSEVSGSRSHRDEPGATHSTLVRTTIDKLNILGMVTADKVVAHLVSTYKEGEDEASVRLVGSRFENLKIAGIPVKVCYSLDVLDGHHRHSKLKEAFGVNEKVRALFGSHELYRKAPPEVKRFLDPPPAAGDEMPHYDGVSVVSIVKELKPDCEAFECHGHVIHLEGFGTIRLGEVRICRKTRHLSMIQIKLGCPVEGETSVGVVDDGGSHGN
ncbi:MAG: hypothetical protein KGN84_23085 [Acidobacteriota bacterium]|nr:hypothetical protein [Acidobacteriota bacterium]